MTVYECNDGILQGEKIWCWEKHLLAVQAAYIFQEEDSVPQDFVMLYLLDDNEVWIRKPKGIQKEVPRWFEFVDDEYGDE